MRARKASKCWSASTVVGTSFRRLPTGDHRTEGRPHGHLRLAKTDVAADQPVRRSLGAHVRDHGVDGLLLVGRGVPRKSSEAIVERVGGCIGFERATWRRA